MLENKNKIGQQVQRNSKWPPKYIFFLLLSHTNALALQNSIIHYIKLVHLNESSFVVLLSDSDSENASCQEKRKNQVFTFTCLHITSPYCPSRVHFTWPLGVSALFPSPSSCSSKTSNLGRREEKAKCWRQQASSSKAVHPFIGPWEWTVLC